jgi:hypothetical protein
MIKTSERPKSKFGSKEIISVTHQKSKMCSKQFQLIIEDGDEEDLENAKKDRKSSFLGVTCNYVNSIIGSGIIGDCLLK